MALGLIGAGADLARDRYGAWVAATVLPSLAVPVGTEVLAADGSLLRAFQVGDGRWRLAPPPEGVDPAALAMLLEWEDRRFRSHRGVDPRAVLRAAVQALRHGRVVSGASTLTMQVARLLEGGDSGSMRGKLRQARLALALERRLSKDEILQLYLRLAPYGGNVEGMRAASLMWFGKEPRRLTPAEAALLVALPQAPEARRPDRPEGRKAALAARNRVLDRAQATGLIDAAEAATARATPLPAAARPFPTLAPLLADRLRRETPAAPRIATTIDAGLQRAAEALLARAALGQTARLSGAALIVDHRSGAILAHVGAANWSDEPSAGFVDMTEALRSPGSTLKPFVYALAFDSGLIHPETLVEDRPAVFGRWQPQNFDRRFRGTVTVRRALIESLNLPVVAVAEALGPARIAAGLRRAGMRVETPGAPGLAVVLGGAGVRLSDLVAGYAALAQGGRRVRLTARAGELAMPDGPGGDTAQAQETSVAGGRSVGAPAGPETSAAGETSALHRIEKGARADAGTEGAFDGGDRTAGAEAGTARVGTRTAGAGAETTRAGAGTAGGVAVGAPVVGPVAAWYATSILAQIAPPTGAPPGRIAWKTGTSYGHRDALAIGYDGALVIGVWLGRPDGTPVPGAFGSELAAPVLFDLFDAAAGRTRPLPPPPAEALTVSTAALPRALQRFAGPRDGRVAAPSTEGPATATAAAVAPLTILFPPDGAELAPRADGLVASVRGGTPPYAWLLNGTPVPGEGPRATFPAAPGYATLSVIDAAGRSQRSAFRVGS